MCCRAWGKQYWGMTVNGYGVPLGRGRKCSKIAFAFMVAQFYEYTKPLNRRLSTGKFYGM